MKYEIDFVNWPGYHFESEISMLTGLELEDILKVTNNITRWSGSCFVKLFQKLGYSCNHRFIKFDKQTPYPCMMRTHKRGDKKHWYGFVYYDGKVYHPATGILTWAEWNDAMPNYCVTSMLQVWI